MTYLLALLARLLINLTYYQILGIVRKGIDLKKRKIILNYYSENL